MKKALSIFLLTAIALCGYAQKNKGDIFLGLKENRYGILNYRLNNWQIGLKQSIFTENVKFQYIQLNFNYDYTYNEHLRFSSMVGGGITYSNSFHDFDFNLLGEYNIRPVSISAEVQPHYDSEFDYSTNYGFTGKCRITSEVSLKLKYTNIPEFRVSERRIKAGIIFESKNLYVEPEISIPTGDHPRFVRVLCSFTYHIKIK